MSLLFPAYLLGLFGLVLPWVLHRFSDQKPEEQLFPSRRFLEETKPPVSRTRTLKYRLLLAVRLLSLLLLCFLFAQPWLNKALDSGAANIHHIIAVDLSLSMQADDRWGIALEKGRNLIDLYGENESVEIIGFDQTLTRVADNSSSKADLLQGLAALEPGYVAADYGVLMQRLNMLAIERSEAVKIWVITDQQRSAMPAQRNTLYAPEVVGFEIISTVTEPQRNVHVRAQAHSDDGVNVRVSVQLFASVSSAETSSRAAIEPQEESLLSTVSIRFGDNILLQREVTLPASGVKNVSFEDLILPRGEQPILTVSVEESDALELDNSVSLLINQSNPTEVASLQSDRSASQDAFVFLSTALQTDSQATVISASGTATQIAPSVLHLVSGRDLSQDVLDLDVRQFVDEGKNALVFSSSKASPSTAPVIRGSEVGLVDESHPMALGDIDWLGTEFYDVPTISVKQSDRILVESAQRAAILVERETPKGRILLLNDRLDGQSSNLPFQPAFVALMQSVIEYFDSSATLPNQLTTGDRLPLSGNVQLLDPDNNSLLALNENLRRSGIVLNRPGVHKVIGLRGPHLVNVLLDTNEADLTLASTDAVSNWHKRFDVEDSTVSNETVSGSSESAIALPDSQAQRARSRIWIWLLPILATAFLLETLLANRRLDVRRDGS